VSATNRRSQSGIDGQTSLLITALALVVVVLGSCWVAVTWGSRGDGG
jgi:hypothetical protein